MVGMVDIAPSETSRSRFAAEPGNAQGTVPEAAIEEDRNPLPCEHDVGGPPRLLEGWRADTKTEAPSVQL
jgi:hypothetical protein